MTRQTLLKSIGAALLALTISVPAMALDDDTTDAAIGGGLGGAAGAAIGNEIGGRNGAIIGGAVGAAGGAAVTTDGDDRDHRHGDRRYHDSGHRRGGGGFCPPGQAKKGRC